MTAVGALAGFSAQYAIWKEVVEAGKMPLHGGEDQNAGAFVVMKTNNGETYYFGNLLNSYIVPQSKDIAPLGPGHFTLWGFLASAVQATGGEPTSGDAINSIFQHAASTVGTPNFGVPQLPEMHRPGLPPRELLNKLWPGAKSILGSTDVPGEGNESLPIGLWPTVVALTAQKLIEQAKDAIDPTLAMRIALEAAVPMSKVDPQTVPQDFNE
ncbi:MAG: hypothetical protein AAGF14_09555 [Pseudomonadota bacterium]